VTTETIAAPEWEIAYEQFFELHSLVIALKCRREELGLSQREFRIRAGINRTTLGTLESGRNINPTLETLFRYAEALGLRVTFGLEPVEEEGQG
jgi:transcriptional regulator with XRE-family HTH domain